MWATIYAIIVMIVVIVIGALRFFSQIKFTKNVDICGGTMCANCNPNQTKESILLGQNVQFNKEVKMSAIVTSKSTTSKRTRNRLIENGPEFNVGREMPIVCFGTLERHVKARLLHSVKTDWVG